MFIVPYDAASTGGGDRRCGIRRDVGAKVMDVRRVLFGSGLSSALQRNADMRLIPVQEAEMKARHFVGVVALATGMILSGTLGLSQSQPPTEGPSVGGTPAWFLQGSFPDPTGRTIVDSTGHVTVPPRSAGDGRGAAGNPAVAARPAPAVEETPACRRSPLCGNRLGRTRQSLQRVQWKQTMEYTFTYPYVLPPGFGGVPAVALDS